ncbi:MAG TPA: hotdog domain-containing protein [Candidatus Latescibacteria bacterium]|nr:hotdog domain-containing protein [Candidatus Latescibacterota bacterium]
MDTKKDPTLRVTLMPRDTNRHGTIFGGIIMSHIDLAGAIEARNACGTLNFVTVAMDNVVFHKPVFLGDVVSLYTETIKVGRTSVTTRIIVEATRADSRETVRVTEANVVYVAVDQDWNPIPVR